MITLIASAVALSLQVEAGVLDMKNPKDDQYVLYHADNGGSYGVQMTSPVLGIAPRLDIGRVVLTAGYRWMGHQYIDTDIIDDSIYFNCRFKGTCPKPIERWYARMTTQEVYASIGYKLHAGAWSIVPTVGIAEERLATSIQVTYPYCYAKGHKDNWYQGNHQDQPHTFVGVDFEHGALGVGLYLLSINKLPTSMGDPGQGESGAMLRVTYRFGL